MIFNLKNEKEKNMGIICGSIHKNRKDYKNFNF